VVLIEAQASKITGPVHGELQRNPSFRRMGFRSVCAGQLLSSRGEFSEGLHYQKDPMAQAKLVTALRGEIFDVAVDYPPWFPDLCALVGKVLSAKECRLLYIPIGFCSRFLCVERRSRCLYKVTAEYARSSTGVCFGTTRRLALVGHRRSYGFPEKMASFRSFS